MHGAIRADVRSGTPVVIVEADRERGVWGREGRPDEHGRAFPQNPKGASRRAESTESHASSHPVYLKGMNGLRQLVDEGIEYEDEFIELYFKVLRDEGFMHFFGAAQETARQLLTTMITESEGHRADLEQVKAALTS